jgi:hypothetical protein
VSVFYVHPGGGRELGSAMVWFDDIAISTTVKPMRANVRRRLIQTEFSIMIGVHLVGPTFDSDLQYECDMFADNIRSIVDLDIATEEHLGSPELVDVATISSTKVERGVTATGCGNRTNLRVSFHARYL